FMLRGKSKFIGPELKYSSAGRWYASVFNSKEKKQISRELDFYTSFLPACSLIFDIGANDGHKTAAFAVLANKVIACEPDPKNIGILNARFKKQTGVSIEPIAVSDQIGTTDLYVHESGSAVNTINPEWKRILEKENNGRWDKPILFSDTSIKVNTTTLDQLIVKHGVPDYIKIDVEGNELNVLKGLSQPVQFISFEVLLPEFRHDALVCIDLIRQLNQHAVFNYAGEEKLVLTSFKEYDEFKSIINELNISHLEILAAAL
ncbi:MAG TPA: FkbM family methyltransferase, partial [Ferruginibacter sp.]|nr:FkbM family methyltransferase [Ferruginibacter sp.]